MANLNQVRVSWTGLRGMPGVSTFYSTGDVSFLLTRLRTFFAAIGGLMPSGLKIDFPSSGVVIDSTTGLAVSAWSSAAPAQVVPFGSGTYAAPAGAVVNWKTGFYVAGRELRAKTFLVPLVSACFQSDGTLDSANLTTIQNAAAAVPGGGNPLVAYGRASASNAPVTSATVPDKVVVLRSRRD